MRKLKKTTHLPFTLVRVGPPLPAEILQPLKSFLGSEGLVELGYLNNEELAGFYSSLDCLVIPSFYEGFGLPVIEGMAARVPVVSSNTSSLPEVGGDLAFYFDPHSPAELASVLAKIATEGVSAEHLNLAYERAKSLSWRKCLEGIYEVYQKVLD
ncbi:MAG: glycosyltransferase family 4 protein [Akkermansiaceae bacterium]|nr:glycosyltransferase family 4 protein [Akkermansiaceae bacterium]